MKSKLLIGLLLASSSALAVPTNTVEFSRIHEYKGPTGTCDITIDNDAVLDLRLTGQASESISFDALDSRNIKVVSSPLTRFTYSWNLKYTNAQGVEKIDYIGVTATGGWIYADDKYETVRGNDQFVTGLEAKFEQISSGGERVFHFDNISTYNSDMFEFKVGASIPYTELDLAEYTGGKFTYTINMECNPL